MLLKYFFSIRSKIITGDRSAITLIHSGVNLFFRGATVLCGLLLIPITLKYLNSFNYGVWLTLSSITGWLSFFDLGLGNGLKNKLAQSLAEGNERLSRVYVSTTYFILSAILLLAFLLYIIAIPLIEWNNIVNANVPITDLNLIAHITIACFCLRLVTDLIFGVMAAKQQSGYIAIVGFISSLFVLVLVFGCSSFIIQRGQSLFIISVISSAVPLIVSLIASIFLFRTTYRTLKPSFRSIDLKEVKKIFSLGLRFFIIQLAVLIVYSTDNLVISQLYGPAAVTDYNIVYKYFSIVIMLWNMALVPYWTAFGNAYFTNDFEWIKRTIRKLEKAWLFLVFALLAMLIISPWVYKMWIGKEFNVPIELSALMVIFVMINTFSALYVTFINGTGKIQIQFYSCIFVAIINIPLSIALAKMLNWGTTGIVLANCISLLCCGPIWNYIQYKKIINKTDAGIWSK
jgi:O-antigen/teichoic acid export membrane protein